MEPKVVESARFRPVSSFLPGVGVDLAGLASMAGKEDIPATGGPETLRLVPELLRLFWCLVGGDEVEVLGVTDCWEEAVDCHDLVREPDCLLTDLNPLSTEVDETSDLVFLDRGL